jgi:Ca2+-binding EF-hand superfamily protein
MYDQLTALFNSFDKDSDGLIDNTSIKLLLKQLSIKTKLIKKKKKYNLQETLNIIADNTQCTVSLEELSQSLQDYIIYPEVASFIISKLDSSQNIEEILFSQITSNNI